MRKSGHKLDLENSLILNDGNGLLLNMDKTNLWVGHFAFQSTRGLWRKKVTAKSVFRILQ